VVEPVEQRGTTVQTTALRRAAVLGHPIAHSLSPILHNAAYRALGLTDWSYSAVDVTAEDLPELLDREADMWAGFSLTMPLKVEVLKWLSNQPRAFRIDPAAQAVGAANTLVFGSEIAAYNTDVYGIVTAIREVIRHGPIESFAILGAGATSASALAAAKELGAEKVEVYARSEIGRTEILKTAKRLGFATPQFGAFSPNPAEFAERRVVPGQTFNRDAWIGVVFGSGPRCWALEYADVLANPTKLSEYDAVISTLPAHAADPLATKMIEHFSVAECRSKPHVHITGTILDVVYDPHPSELISTWSALGGAVVTGDRMLLHQAAKQVELMTGQSAPLAAMEEALNEALGSD